MAKARVGGLSGWLALDKPGGMSSAAAVAAVRRLAGGVKAGHAGTLDPLATGVLPIALGEATKTVPFLMEAIKRYRFTLRWGERRATDDAEGEVVERSASRPGPAEIVAALPRFVGCVWQVPPAYSAVKVGGARAYKLARQGTPPVLAPRTVEVRRFSLVSAAGEEAVFDVECGKGTYVRALARDLAEALGTVGYVRRLHRAAVGPFTDEHAISLDMLRALGHSRAIGGRVAPVDAVLADIPALRLTVQDTARLRCGCRVPAPGASAGTVRVVDDIGLVALAEIQAGQVRPLRIFNI